MTSDPSGRPGRPASTSSRPLVLGAVALAGAGTGWFMLSWRVMHTPAGDAGGEALGVVFALLVVLSAIGAIRRGNDRDG